MFQDAHSPVVAEKMHDPLEVNSDAPAEPESESEAETAFCSEFSDSGARALASPIILVRLS